MKVSRAWLQTYFEQPLPSAEKLAELFTFHAFEVEGAEKAGDDDVIDVKVLPDRAHYALSHVGVAEEVAALTGLKMKTDQSQAVPVTNVRSLTITVQDADFCPRYTGRVIENVTITDSSELIRKRLEAVGSRAINSVVDATNYTMLDLGQPLHAFDADKVIGGITVRYAKEGEKITTLDGKEITLTTADSVIADDEGPLAIAGIKGGKKAEVTASTKNIIIESANFNASAVRKTSARVGIRNESSKRYENAITPEKTAPAMNAVTERILSFSKGARVGEVMDMYPRPEKTRIIITSALHISEALGVLISEDEIVELLGRQRIEVQKKDGTLEITIPAHRLDLVIPEDITEEVGRLYGYDKIPSILPKQTVPDEHIQNKEFYYTEKIKTLLCEQGFSEVYLYSLVNKGHHEVTYPLASDKSFLRTSLATGILKALDLNVQNAPLLGTDTIKIVEIGNVFAKEGEYTALAVGIKHAVKKKGQNAQDDIVKTVELITAALPFTAAQKTELKNAAAEVQKTTPGVIEFNLTELINGLPALENISQEFPAACAVTYTPFSPYPFAVRDVAVFVPSGINPEEIRTIIIKHAGDLLVRTDLFDTFVKKNEDGNTKTSYAFRLVLQSKIETLKEQHITTVMDAIYAELKERGWEIR